MTQELWLLMAGTAFANINCLQQVTLNFIFKNVRKYNNLELSKILGLYSKYYWWEENFMGLFFDWVLLPETVTINTVGGQWLRICTVDEGKKTKNLLAMRLSCQGRPAEGDSIPWKPRDLVQWQHRKWNALTATFRFLYREVDSVDFTSPGNFSNFW